MSQVLKKGDSLIVSVKASKRHTSSGIHISKGESYEISATGKWRDAGFEPTDAGGFPSKNAVMKFARYLKPMPKENYLKLIAKVSGEHYAVGTSAVIHCTKNGKLIFQPNDAFFFYGNNSGTLIVTIRRID